MPCARFSYSMKRDSAGAGAGVAAQRRSGGPRDCTALAGAPPMTRGWGKEGWCSASCPTHPLH